MHFFKALKLNARVIFWTHYRLWGSKWISLGKKPIVVKLCGWEITCTVTEEIYFVRILQTGKWVFSEPLKAYCIAKEAFPSEQCDKSDPSCYKCWNLTQPFVRAKNSLGFLLSVPAPKQLFSNVYDSTSSLILMSSAALLSI